ncbi:MAG: dipeptidase [Anaerolineae bacterium]
MDEMTDRALGFAAEHQRQALGELIQLLEFPSISAQPVHASDVRRAAEWLATHMRSIGLMNVTLHPTAGHPLVYGDWLHAPGKPTILIYGHYDVQPIDPLNLWSSDPFEPLERAGNLYGRGTADDKGQAFATLKAVEAYLKTCGALPVNVKFILEGEEETGSAHLTPFIEANVPLLAADAVLICDSAWVAPDAPTLIYGLRGLTYVELEVVGPSQDLHSGAFGGPIYNPIQALCDILAHLKDDQGRVQIPGFYDRVRPLSDEERHELARIPFDEAEFRKVTGVPAMAGEAGYSIIEQLGARPTLDIHGIIGGYTGPGAKTIIPSRVAAKISMRLVPDQDPEEIADLFAAEVKRLAPPTVRVNVRRFHAASPAIVDRDTPALRAAARALETAFGKPVLFARDGGSIPVVTDFDRCLGAPTVLMGFGLPDDNIHAPNEKFALAQFFGGIRATIYFFGAMGEQSA